MNVTIIVCKSVCLLWSIHFFSGNHCLQCYECAHLVADSGSTFLDRMLEGIRGWYDADCLDIPTAYRLKTCDPGQACVVFKAQAQVSLHLQGTSKSW